MPFFHTRPSFTHSPNIDHLEDELRRVLQISIDDDYGVGGNVIQRGCNGGLMTKVTAQTNIPKPCVVLVALLKDRGCLVEASIVDHQNRGCGSGRRQFRENVPQSLDQLRNDLILIEEGNGYGHRSSR